MLISPQFLIMVIFQFQLIMVIFQFIMVMFQLIMVMFQYVYPEFEGNDVVIGDDEYRIGADDSQWQASVRKGANLE